jgi:hypothetical protein
MSTWTTHSNTCMGSFHLENALIWFHMCFKQRLFCDDVHNFFSGNFMLDNGHWVDIAHGHPTEPNDLTIKVDAQCPLSVQTKNETSLGS